jgi:peptidoglycan hydrolase-like protein with peptidoglycan-binding domain
MTFSLTWLPEVLERVGLKVAEVPGWRTRGRGEMGTIRGVMCHHTATTAKGNMPTLRMLQTGRPDLPGPLAQLGLGRDGTYYIVAAGRANHAGAGVWEGLNSGNSNFIGIEAEHSGQPADAWPDVQMDAYMRGVAAILKHVGAQASMCCGHKEFALPSGRKPDPTFDMPLFRRGVQGFLLGVTPRPLIPSVDAKARPTLRRGDRDLSPAAHVAALQKAIGIPNPDGVFGRDTEAAARAFQRAHGLVPDGIVGPRSWAIIDTLPPKL